jgi:hypothetical protein
MEGLGKTARPAFGWLISSYAYPIQEVLGGALETLGDLPLLGFSTSAELSPAGRSRRSVVAALFAGEGVQGRAGWWPDFNQDSRSAIQNMLHVLNPPAESSSVLLLAADGLNGDASLLGEYLAAGNFVVAGCLAGGEVNRGRTYQIGGRQSGSGGLAGMLLSGEIAIGVGAAHGWRPVGALARLTRVQGQWVRMLDDEPASHIYARWFGFPARDWSFPPLNDLVRQYPLGVHGQPGQALQIRSPLRMEADGSLRMNSRLAEGALVDLMIGTIDGCQQAARQAAGQAKAMLGDAQPVAALLLVDVAWQVMLELQPQGEIEAVRDVIGAQTPIFGGYTLGQLVRRSSNDPFEFLNQHIVVVLFAGKA